MLNLTFIKYLLHAFHLKQHDQKLFNSRQAVLIQPTDVNNRANMLTQ